MGGGEVIMGMCQEMVVLREQAKPVVGRCRCRAIGQTKYGQFKLRSITASSARMNKGKAVSFNVGPCQSPTFDDAHVLITLAYGLASR